MIIIQEDVWRAECIAGLGIDDENNVIQLYPLNTIDCLEYEYESLEETVAEYKKIVTSWERELGQSARNS